MTTIQQLEINLNNIANENSRNKKEDILKSLKDDKPTLEILKFLNDPAIVTNLAYKKVNKPVKNKNYTDLVEFDELIELCYWMTDKTGSDKDIATIHNFIAKYPEQEDFIKKIVTKSFKTGLSAKTLNKIYGKDFIFVMEVQLAETYKENDKKKFPDGTLFGVTIKFDGHRNLFHPNKKVFLTRNGKTNVGLNQLATEATLITNYLKEKYNYDFYLDGEILIEKTDKPKEEWFNETSKLLGAKKENKTNLKYILFDLCPKDEFEVDKKSKLNYFDRRDILEDSIKNLNLKHIEIAELLYKGTDKTQIIPCYEKAISESEEGVMINLDAPYFCKRTSTLLKVKPAQSADLEIIGFESGAPNTKYENTLGAIIVNYKGNKVSVGSGLTDEKRDEIWKNQEQYLGSIAEIIYTTESTNQNDNSISLRFPRFKTIRTDKTIDDINIE